MYSHLPKSANLYILLYMCMYSMSIFRVKNAVFGMCFADISADQNNGRQIAAPTLGNGGFSFLIVNLHYKHEFNIIIDKDAVYMVMDDETDTPIEKDVPLSEMTEVGQVFTVIREFVESV